MNTIFTKSAMRNIYLHIHHAAWRWSYRLRRNICRPFRRLNYRMHRYNAMPRIERITVKSW